MPNLQSTLLVKLIGGVSGPARSTAAAIAAEHPVLELAENIAATLLGLSGGGTTLGMLGGTIRGHCRKNGIHFGAWDRDLRSFAASLGYCGRGIG